MADEVGRTAVIVPVPELDPLVGPARERYDPAAVLGVPAHVTVLYPFLPLAEVDAEVLGALAAIVAAEPAPTVRFARCERFPGVLWLAPEPADVFVRLTRAVAARWPQAPPYGGRFGEHPTPHLTVTLDAADADSAEVERSLTPQLPVTATPAGAVLIAFDGEQWSEVEHLRFGR